MRFKSFPLIHKVLTVQFCLCLLCLQLHQVIDRLIHPDSEGQLPRTMPHENRHHHAIITIRITILARDQSLQPVCIFTWCNLKEKKMRWLSNIPFNKETVIFIYKKTGKQWCISLVRDAHIFFKIAKKRLLFLLYITIKSKQTCSELTFFSNA